MLLRELYNQRASICLLETQSKKHTEFFSIQIAHSTRCQLGICEFAEAKAGISSVLHCVKAFSQKNALKLALLPKADHLANLTEVFPQLSLCGLILDVSNC